MATAASPVAAAPASAPATRNVGIDAALTDQKRRVGPISSTCRARSHDADFQQVANDSQSALVKLLFFTFLMVSGPIGTYFLSLKHVWGGAPVPMPGRPDPFRPRGPALMPFALFHIIHREQHDPRSRVGRHRRQSRRLCLHRHRAPGGPGRTARDKESGRRQEEAVTWLQLRRLCDITPSGSGRVFAAPRLSVAAGCTRAESRVSCSLVNGRLRSWRPSQAPSGALRKPLAKGFAGLVWTITPAPCGGACSSIARRGDKKEAGLAWGDMFKQCNAHASLICIGAIDVTHVFKSRANRHPLF